MRRENTEYPSKKTTPRPAKKEKSPAREDSRRRKTDEEKPREKKEGKEEMRRRKAEEEKQKEMQKAYAPIQPADDPGTPRTNRPKSCTYLIIVGMARY